MSIIHKTDNIISNTNTLTILNTKFPDKDINSVVDSILTNGTSINTYEIGLRTLQNDTSAIFVDTSTPITGQTLITNSSTNAIWGFINDSVKKNVLVETIINGTLATSFENGDTINGVVLTTNDRILIRNQTDPIENGIYIVNASGAPTRSSDYANGSNVAGTSVISQTTKTLYLCSNADGSAIVGTDPLEFIASNMLENRTNNYYVLVNNVDRLEEFLLNAGSGTIEISNGTYQLTSVISIGGSNKIISGKGMPTLQLNGNLSLLEIDNGFSNILIEDIIFDLAITSDVVGINILDCSNVIIKNCRFINNGIDNSPFIRFNSTYSNITIINCQFEIFNTISNIGIDFITAHDGVIIENCTFTRTSITGDVIYINGEIGNSIISNCTFINYNNSSAITLNTDTRTQIINSCLFVNCDDGITLTGNGNCIITNNIIDTCTNCMLISESAIISGNVLKNFTTNGISLNDANSSYSIVCSNSFNSSSNCIVNANTSDGNIICNNSFPFSYSDIPISIDVAAVMLVRILRNANYNFNGSTLGAMDIRHSDYIVVDTYADTEVSIRDSTLNSHGKIIVCGYQKSFDVIYTSQTFAPTNTTPLNGVSYTVFSLTNSLGAPLVKTSIIWTGDGWRQFGEGNAFYL